MENRKENYEKLKKRQKELEEKCAKYVKYRPGVSPKRSSLSSKERDELIEITKKLEEEYSIEGFFSKSDKEIASLLKNTYKEILEKNPDLSSKLLAEKALKLACPEITDTVAESLAFQYHDIDNLVLGLLQMKKEHKKLKKYELNKE